MRRCTLDLILIATCALWAAAAVAGEPTEGGTAAAEPRIEGDADAARPFFQQAQTAYTQGQYAQAAQLFQQAYDAWHHPAFLYNRGQALTRAASYQEAIVDALVNADLAGELPPGRLACAAERCGSLARWAATQQRARSEHRRSTGGTVVDVGRVASSFTLSERAETLLASSASSVRWVRIEPEPNVAIGETPLGPFFEGGAVPSLVVPLDDRDVAAEYTAGPDVLTVVVGRELHRDPGALAAAATITDLCDALVVDLGFVNSDLVDIATFGASRLVGEALLALVEESA